MSDWPKHPDGTNKSIGEMEPDDRRRVLREAAMRFKAKCESPVAQKKMQEYLDKIKEL